MEVEYFSFAFLKYNVCTLTWSKLCALNMPRMARKLKLKQCKNEERKRQKGKVNKVGRPCKYRSHGVAQQVSAVASAVEEVRMVLISMQD